ncbi:hypothetical protein A5893_12135 [Pedobacter psychrophilus]|uniref:Oligosaccharide repeat unit polymerase n=1 Tax=Pedobacter psychrophilus TaxID=1826909 RepID=A0A179DCM6_9SPHI|nr:hypothetical protein [Pedobacter psychrophilus]OAQ38791.1 hypothetical protein A5893_12135 [Pedobacter psychrophilus]
MLENKNIFNPFVLLFLVQLPIEISKFIIGPWILLDEGILDKFYNFAILMQNLGLFAELILLLFAARIAKKYTLASSLLNSPINPVKMLRVAFAFYLFFLIFFILLSSHSFGIVNWIKNPRQGYQYYREGVGFLWVFSISCLSISWTLCCLFYKKIFKLFLIFPLFSISAFLLGSKGIVLDFFIFLFLILILRKYKYTKQLVWTGTPILIIFVLINFFGNLQDASFSELFSYFDHFPNGAMYYKAYFNNEIPLYNGKIFITDFWNLVPRGFYPNKPFVYGVTYINEYFWPGAAELSHTPAFGGQVNYFGDFGIIGVFLLNFLNPLKFASYFFLCQLLKHYSFNKVTKNQIILLLFLFFLAPAFLFSLSFPLNLIFFIICMSILIFINKLKLKS